jgi:hypothetical protein
MWCSDKYSILRLIVLNRASSATGAINIAYWASVLYFCIHTCTKSSIKGAPLEGLMIQFNDAQSHSTLMN